MALPEYAGPNALRRLLDAVLTIGSGLDLPTILQNITESAVELVDAKYGALGVLDESGTRLSQFITVGVDPETHRRIGHLPEGKGILGLLIVEPRPIRLPDLREHTDSYGFPPDHPPMKSFLGVPIKVRDSVFGNLYLTDKQTSETFTDVDEELVVALAAAAGIAIENARLHSRVQELALLEDRERIARDLHDTVIQRLFATGLSLQGAGRLAQRPEVAERIQSAVDDLDLTVKHIRSAIFALESNRALPGSLRNKVLSVATETAAALGFQPEVLFDGPVDTAVPSEVEEQLLVTIREALTNVAKHAAATRADVDVTVRDNELVLRVRDNGRGLPDAPGTSGHGLRNMESRAATLSGDFSVKASPSGGTALEWRVPISD